MKTDDGGCAFPFEGGGDRMKPEAGMSLRDWFAGQAVSPLVEIATDRNETVAMGRRKVEHTIQAEKIAEAAYAIADALLAERAKERP